MKPNKELLFAIHGGGNIGLGCMADIISKSPYPYRIIATSRDEFRTNLINLHNCFWLEENANNPQNLTCVKNITMVKPTSANISNLYLNADLLAICLTEKALQNSAIDIAQGLLSRYKTRPSELKILILMNKPKCAQFVRTEIYKALLGITYRKTLVDKILESIIFIPTVVDRIVTKNDKKTILMHLQQQLIAKNISISVENYYSTNHKILLDIISKHQLKFVLYKAENAFSLFVPQQFSESIQFPGMKKVNQIETFAEIKNKFVNGPHAMLAWMGGLLGCKTIAEAINTPSMNWYIHTLMEQEIAPILKAEYPEIKSTLLSNLKTNFIKRCKMSKHDPIIRVGRDPLRKLKSGGRVRGLIELKQKHNLSIATPELEYGMAAGILYAIKKVDPTNEECRTIREIYKRGSYKGILCFKGRYGTETYHGLDDKKDQQLINKILKRIALVEKFINFN